jgi:hypothetical protein
LILGEDELASYKWLASETEDDALVLANIQIGNRIPAFTNNRVLYGHPFETPYAEQQEQLVLRLLSSAEDPDDVMDELKVLDVRYVVISPEELRQGDLKWLDEIKPVFVAGEYAVYEMPK